ncbi:protein VACUOLELESS GAMETOPHYTES [Oryza sativa Japonica Group]|jgi:hypothetical protein|uniref:Phorbol-ester/DAG-type domain-containing protein n=4 Tax=Oryza TaxID=4527 RepID=A3BM29_ORYSJ|nr:uncharacterized protein LOC107276880 [Oryza sativa Japonica Group]AAK55786.1 Hypothetical protein [Oryza sativa]EAZ40618.1 hypothetical protein OsJ_25082 [Oryza sativa Japonica Group]BAC84648.1 hypothetical protein [Oryza sativa Japonica Group]BAT02598.1 Os07g0609600 [Oryza sativa Japonica Group]
MAASVSCFYHPQHLVREHRYGAKSAGVACTACERRITGDGYRCRKCDFNIHHACLALPVSASVDEHREHALTLSSLAASGTCNTCKVTSQAGCYLYRCAPCGFNVHPRCMPPPSQQQQQEEAGTAWEQTVQVGKGILQFGFFVLRATDDMTTGGLASPVIDVMEGLFGLYDSTRTVRRRNGQSAA